MRVEKWNLNGKEIDIEIVDENEYEENIDPSKLEETKDLSKELKQIGDNDDK